MFFYIGSVIFPSNNYVELTRLTYKPLQHSSLMNVQLAFYKSNPSLGAQWWISDNMQLSGIVSPNINDPFRLYNNVSLGYYIQNIKWFYSSSNFIEISLHRIKYNDSASKWINCAYKSRYNFKNFIFGYDINHFFWKGIKNDFISLVIGYDINKKIILELKSAIDKNNIFSSFNFSIPL